MSEKEKKDNKQKGLAITFRMYEVPDVLRFEQWKKELNASGSNVSTALADIVKEYLLEKEKKIALKGLREDLFYSFRKVLFASLAPFSANIIREILKNRAELLLLNKKIDVLLNTIFKDEKHILKNLNIDLLEEARYFEQMRELLNNETQVKIEKINKKIAKVKDHQKKFEELHQKSNSEWDAEITTLLYKDYEFDPDTDLDEVEVKELV
ncbi:Mbov_0398 family ICE element protein [Mycoplasma putrefaciens]|uniref:ICEF Integrative Conjugal Element-II n=1 Tax=Mycoplasma putrefaciens Mput9231 TaxID=1292033 RepID=M9WBV1_9MOLU|nr:hypothetical protein [Mycoplasma putrefaciens]AGJ90637.1 hypothetical protein MPUT9231_2040 [Mycoplasma putrefaciens Mput9231]